MHQHPVLVHCREFACQWPVERLVVLYLTAHYLLVLVERLQGFEFLLGFLDATRLVCGLSTKLFLFKILFLFVVGLNWNSRGFFQILLHVEHGLDFVTLDSGIFHFDIVGGPLLFFGLKSGMRLYDNLLTPYIAPP